MNWPLSIAKWVSIFVAAATVALTLMGFGHDAAYLEVFMLHPEDMQRSPIDYLVRSWHVVVHLLSKLNALKDLGFVHLAELAFWKLWWVWLLFPLAAAFASWVVRGSARSGVPAVGRLICKTPLVGPPVRSLGLACWAVLAPVFNAACRWARRLVALATPWARGPVALATLWARRWFWVGASVGAAAGVYLALVVFLALLVGLFAVIVSIVAVVPSLGVASGVEQAKIQVIQAATCSQVTKHEGARCVRIHKDGAEVARGRVIDVLPSQIWLYRRCDDKTFRVPLDGASIETMSSLGTADTPGTCRSSEK